MMLQFNKMASEIKHYIMSIVDFENILKQMKKSICKIRDGTGFLCKIPYPDKNKYMPSLITANHALGEDGIKEGEEVNITLNDDKTPKTLSIKSNRIILINKEYDIAIIEVKEDDNLGDVYYIELEDTENLNDTIKLNKHYKEEKIYLLHYPLKKELNFSFASIKRIDKKKFIIYYDCQTESGSSGSPLINMTNNKLIEFHIGKNNHSRMGRFIKTS